MKQKLFLSAAFLLAVSGSLYSYLESEAESNIFLCDVSALADESENGPFEHSFHDPQSCTTEEGEDGLIWICIYGGESLLNT